MARQSETRSAHAESSKSRRSLPGRPGSSRSRRPGGIRRRCSGATIGCPVAGQERPVLVRVDVHDVRHAIVAHAQRRQEARPPSSPTPTTATRLPGARRRRRSRFATPAPAAAASRETPPPPRRSPARSSSRRRRRRVGAGAGARFEDEVLPVVLQPEVQSRRTRCARNSRASEPGREVRSSARSTGPRTRPRAARAACRAPRTPTTVLVPLADRLAGSFRTNSAGVGDVLQRVAAADEVGGEVGVPRRTVRLAHHADARVELIDRVAIEVEARVDARLPGSCPAYTSARGTRPGRRRSRRSPSCTPRTV